MLKIELKISFRIKDCGDRFYFSFSFKAKKEDLIKEANYYRDLVLNDYPNFILYEMKFDESNY